jgi:hypothetical protein
MRPVGGLGRVVEEVDDELTPCQIAGYGCWPVPDAWPSTNLVCEACGEVLEGWIDQAEDASRDDGLGQVGPLVDPVGSEDDAYWWSTTS